MRTPPVWGIYGRGWAGYRSQRPDRPRTRTVDSSLRVQGARAARDILTRVDDDDLASEPEPGERRLNIHLDPSDIAGVYANFANITFSRYEFTLTFARIEHEVEEGDVPGAVVARVNASPRFVGS